MHYKTVWRIYMLMLGSEKSKESITRGFAIVVIFTIFWSGKMQHDMICFFLFASFVDCVTTDDQCWAEINIQGMRLEGFVFTRTSASAPHICNVRCEQEIACQSYNYNRKEKICELNNRAKEARPEGLRLDPAWFFIQRLNG